MIEAEAYISAIEDHNRWHAHIAAPLSGGNSSTVDQACRLARSQLC